jgi:hypothetical protein
MRAAIGVSIGFLAGLLASVLPAEADDAQAPRLDNSAAAIDDLAQRVFASADRNRNHFLNKSEFAGARAMLAAEIESLGRQGRIGKPKKTNKDRGQNAQVAAPSGASYEKLARSNRVSQAEFTFFAHGAFDEADEAWRQMRAVAGAQRRAYNAQKRALEAQRRGIYRD